MLKPNDVRDSRPPVFCISLPRNGTLSLAAAFAALGWKSFHAPLHLEPEWYDQPGAFFSDTPVYAPELFEALDQKYPAARFIYVSRSVASWLASVQGSKVADCVSRHPVDLWCYEHVLAVPPFDAKVWAEKYRAHQRAVLSYFAGRSNFLSLSLDSLTWEPLCRLVGVESPGISFPRLNPQMVCGTNGPSWEEWTRSQAASRARENLRI